MHGYTGQLIWQSSTCLISFGVSSLFSWTIQWDALELLIMVLCWTSCSGNYQVWQYMIWYYNAKCYLNCNTTQESGMLCAWNARQEIIGNAHRFSLPKHWSQIIYVTTVCNIIHNSMRMYNNVLIICADKIWYNNYQNDSTYFWHIFGPTIEYIAIHSVLTENVSIT